MQGIAYPEGWPEGKRQERNITESPTWGQSQEDPEEEPEGQSQE